MRPLAAQTTRDRIPGWYHPLLLLPLATFVASKGTWSRWSRCKTVERTQQFLLRLDCKDFLLKLCKFVFRRKIYLRSRIFRRRLSIVAKIDGGGGEEPKITHLVTMIKTFIVAFSCRFVSIFIGALHSFRLYSNSRHALSKTQPVRYARRKLKGNINSSQHRNICSSSE